MFLERKVGNLKLISNEDFFFLENTDEFFLLMNVPISHFVNMVAKLEIKLK